MHAWRQRGALTGDYRSWADALADARGYADELLLKRALAAVREVEAGRAAWERDGATFPQPQVNAPLLSVLREIAAAEGGWLVLVDFGGALGSTWRQHRAELAGLAQLEWRVVEQPHVVAAGRMLAPGPLRFHASLAEAWSGEPPRAALFSSVLPYLEDPWAVLAEVAARGCRHVIIDRTSFAADGRRRLAVQRVSAALGGGSYPCWLFDQEGLLAPLAAEYRLVREWTPTIDDIHPAAVFRGFWLSRRDGGRDA
ncbi:MAG: methyltransferase, TIGR04325 family [Opitutae bacterium]|nr:methyltransferase, TIGR04325 family [Opitutae bacterium]